MFVVRLVVCLFDRLIVCLIARLLACVFGYVVDWCLLVLFVGWSIGDLFVRLVIRLSRCLLVCVFACSFVCLIVVFACVVCLLLFGRRFI